jgi:hypothetical protein
MFDTFSEPASESRMNRDQLIRSLRRYARKHGLHFLVNTRKGKGSHYWVEVGSEATTIQGKLNPGRIERVSSS